MPMNRPLILRTILAAAGVILVGLLTFAFFSQDNLFRFFLDPRIPYQTYVAPPAPDYTDSAAWARPPTHATEKHMAQVFVVTPTVYWGGKDWNTPMDAPKPHDRLLRIAIPNWAGPLRTAGAVTIPYYRSASLYSFLTTRKDARDARRLAYLDILHAFDQFIKETDSTEPIILVGVEQGGLHVLGLLQDRFDDPYLRERLAAAYIIDFAVPLDLFDGALKGLRPCRDSEDSRCIVTYGAFQARHRAEIKRFHERTMVWDERGRLRSTQGRMLACVNPVLGGANADFAPRRLHRGGANATGLEWGATPAPLPEQTSTQCEDGILLIDRPKSRHLMPKKGLGRHFKPKTYNLFYVDLARDAQIRIKNLRQRFDHEGRLAPPLNTVIELNDSPIKKTPEP